MEKKKNNTKEFIKLYVPELMQLDGFEGDEKTCLMMAQLEYWFGLKPDGFYKFMTVPTGDSRAYREGDSWTEEMGMSREKINNGLKPICTHYQSFTEYKNQEGDKFKGNYYCSYNHKPSHITYYFRNHEKVNRALGSLSLEKKSPIFRAKYSSKLGNENNPNSGDKETTIPDIEISQVIYTENTTKNNSKIVSKREEEKIPLSFHQQEDGFEKEESRRESNIKDYSGVVPNDDVIIGEPVFDNQQPEIERPIRLATSFPNDFTITKDMREWAKQTISSEIDLAYATQKFILHFQGEKRKDWTTEWAKWMLRERPETNVVNAAQERLANLKVDASSETSKGSSQAKNFSEYYREVMGLPK